MRKRRRRKLGPPPWDGLTYARGPHYHAKAAKIMGRFDDFPPEVRQAIANARYTISIAEIRQELLFGNDGKGYTGPEMARMIRQRDKAVYDSRAAYERIPSLVDRYRSNEAPQPEKLTPTPDKPPTSVPSFGSR